MRIGRRLSLTLVVQGILLAVIILCLLNLVAAHKRLADAEARRYESYLLADELRQSSDDLTRMARTFVVTGDPRFAEYFTEVGRIRDGDAARPPGYERIYWDFVTHDPQYRRTDGTRLPLLERMRLAGFTDAELALLEEAKRRSDALIGLERQAMALMVPDGPTEASTGDNPEEEEDRALARGIMHGEQYHAAKAAIMEPINRFLSTVDLRTAQDRDAAQAAVERAIELSVVASALLAIFSIMSAVTLNMHVRRPMNALNAWAEQVRQGDMAARTRLGGEDEFHLLSRSIDAMADSVEASLMALRDEVARRTAAEEEVRHLANHDALTGLPALRLLRDRLELGVALAARQGTNLGLLFIDLDGFKPINDAYGHGAGDVVLRVVGERLRATVRESDTVGRIGGDEFLVILPDITDTSSVCTVADKLSVAVNAPILLPDQKETVNVTASIGLAVYPLHGEDPEILLRVADEAMYRMKNEAKAHFH